MFRNSRSIYLVRTQNISFSCSVGSTLCNPMDCRMPGFPVHHQLLNLAQTHVHWISDAIQPSHPLLSSSPPAFNLAWHQGLFQWVSSSPQVTKYWSFNFSISPEYSLAGLISFRIDSLDLLESPLDCKEIQPVNLKGNQPCILIGRSDAKVKAPILWPLDGKNWLIGKDPDPGKDWR